MLVKIFVLCNRSVRFSERKREFSTRLIAFRNQRRHAEEELAINRPKLSANERRKLITKRIFLLRDSKMFSWCVFTPIVASQLRIFDFFELTGYSFFLHFSQTAFDLSPPHSCTRAVCCCFDAEKLRSENFREKVRLQEILFAGRSASGSLSSSDAPFAPTHVFQGRRNFESSPLATFIDHLLSLSLSFDKL